MIATTATVLAATDAQLVAWRRAGETAKAARPQALADDYNRLLGPRPFGKAVDAAIARANAEAAAPAALCLVDVDGAPCGLAAGHVERAATPHRSYASEQLDRDLELAEYRREQADWQLDTP